MREKVRTMKSLDIFPISVPVADTGYHSVSLYCDDKGIAKDLPLNQRAAAFIEACGYPPQSFRGDCYVGRIFDDEKRWGRRDFTIAEASSLAPWVKQCKELREKSG